MKVVITTRHEWDLCGDEYLDGKYVDIEFSDDEVDRRWLQMKIEGIEGVFSFTKDELQRTLKIFL